MQKKLTMHTKVKQFALVCAVVGVVLILTAIIMLPFWLIIRILFQEIQYWHTLAFALLSESVCLWTCCTRELRERCRTMRIVEHIVGWALFVTIIIFIFITILNS